MTPQGNGGHQHKMNGGGRLLPVTASPYMQLGKRPNQDGFTNVGRYLPSLPAPTIERTTKHQTPSIGSGSVLTTGLALPCPAEHPFLLPLVQRTLFI